MKSFDLTKGVIWRAIITFCIPLLARSLFQQLYTTVDAVIIGQFAGKQGLAAIDAVYSLLKLPTNFLVGLSNGAMILISQYCGGKKERELSDTVHNAMIFSALSGLLFSVIGVVIAPMCISWVKVPSDIAPLSLAYVRICFGGLIFSTVFNMGAGILQAIGDSKTPFYILLATGSINVFLDIVFIRFLCWGVTGAALATVAAQVISALIVLCPLIRGKNRVHVKSAETKLDMSVLKSIVWLGLPIGAQSVFYPIANMMIQTAINQTGTDNIAAWALCGKLDFLIWLCADSLASAISVFVAQNYGAKQHSRIRQGVQVGLIMTVSVIAAISTILYFWYEPLGRLVINADDYDVIPLMGGVMRFLAPLYFTYVFGEVLSGAIRGMGETFKPMLLTLAGTCITRIVWIAFVPHNNLHTILVSYPLSWILTALLFVGMYINASKKYLKI